MSTVARFLSGDLVYAAVNRWLDKKLAKPSGFKRARRIGAARAYVRIGRYNEGQDDPVAWYRAYRKAAQLQSLGALGTVGRLSFPSRACLETWFGQGKF